MTLDTAILHLSNMVAFPTVSDRPNRALIDWYAERLEAVGARVRVLAAQDGGKANLFATIGPEGDGGIVLSGHTDVVPAEEAGWTSDPFALREDDGLLYARGSCDMKGFLACALAVAALYAEGTLRRPLHFALTHDEEVGCLGAQALVDQLKSENVSPAVAIIGEPTSMKIIDGHKGCCEYTTTFHGLEGHGSDPDRGVSATEYAARFMVRLLELRADLKDRAPANGAFDPPYTTVQVGRFEGGVARNVIAGLAHVDWELRPVNAADKDHAIRTMRDYCNSVLLPAMRAVHESAKIETSTIGDVVGLEPVTDNEARDIVCALTGDNGTATVAFGTEAGLFQQLGCAAVVCGPGSIEQAHKADEYVSRDQLAACITMLERLDARLR
ncbi:Acetylornithine deacetylase [Rhodobacteraceae bacterium THAF1]|uniref:acetylornithine deacetylase n=1 Tax=Palleronia sp. THAF1 TaxID=2587842 RepID=UPI000F4088BD|nr:acetylornithine deacetylase [Palleronia sp. THAF1]QFU09493.1 Acetylornithine deacetylase [Palleronia sp. THAF1]VDC21827.1 Acetylornithine deacetylase [Rhodobacteraceae bacterium THAF1]